MYRLLQFVYLRIEHLLLLMRPILPIPGAFRISMGANTTRVKDPIVDAHDGRELAGASWALVPPEFRKNVRIVLHRFRNVDGQLRILRHDVLQIRFPAGIDAYMRVLRCLADDLVADIISRSRGVVSIRCRICKVFRRADFLVVYCCFEVLGRELL